MKIREDYKRSLRVLMGFFFFFCVPEDELELHFRSVIFQRNSLI